MQFDIQWDELTIGEHLYFYARLKGISQVDERKAVEQALKNVSLTSFENRLTKGLSGGEKRRLSIAISLLGNPAVVFLDEPTVIEY
jgi:ABC-type multidrug transport system ATPase subunit